MSDHLTTTVQVEPVTPDTMPPYGEAVLIALPGDPDFDGPWVWCVAQLVVTRDGFGLPAPGEWLLLEPMQDQRFRTSDDGEGVTPEDHGYCYDTVAGGRRSSERIITLPLTAAVAWATLPAVPVPVLETRSAWAATVDDAD